MESVQSVEMSLLLFQVFGLVSEKLVYLRSAFPLVAWSATAYPGTYIKKPVKRHIQVVEERRLDLSAKKPMHPLRS